MTLRPKTFDDFIGNKNEAEIIKILLESTKIKNEVFPHTVISGPPGTGKSTLSHVIANELGVEIQQANGASTRTVKDVLPYIMRIGENSVFFIDEVHRLTKITEEYLYTVIEDGYCTIGRGEYVEKINIPPFTMIGATTELGLLTKPFRDRFKHHLHLSLYQKEELFKLCCQNAEKLKVEVDKDAIYDIVNRSRGVPRILNKNLEWCRDFALTRKEGKISKNTVDKAMELARIDSRGLTEDDRKYLDLLKSAAQPLGLSTISSSLNLAESTLKDVIEPYLIELRLIIKTQKGRVYIGE